MISHYLINAFLAQHENELQRRAEEARQRRREPEESTTGRREPSGHLTGRVPRRRRHLRAV